LWIKLGQWASHRGDIFGEQITKSLETLRDAATPHSARETREQFAEVFGKKIEDVFSDFENVPLASGSIA
jgi:aarF domain-containing kinase